MKKTLLLTFLVLLLTISVSIAGPPNWTITALNTSTYVAIEVPEGANLGSVSVYVSDASAVLIAKDAAGTDARPFPAIGTETWTNVSTIYGSNSIYYAKSTAGTPNLILLYQKR